MKPKASQLYGEKIQCQDYPEAVRLCDHQGPNRDKTIDLAVATQLISSEALKVKATLENGFIPSLREISESLVDEIRTKAALLLESEPEDARMEFVQRKILRLTTAKAVLDLVLDGSWSFQNWLMLTFEYGLSAEQSIEERIPLPETMLEIPAEEQPEFEDKQDEAWNEEGSGEHLVLAQAKS